MWQRYTERGRRVLDLAQQEAARLGDGYVAMEHLLLALVREHDCIAARMIVQLGVPLERVYAEIDGQTSSGQHSSNGGKGYSSRLKNAVDLAAEEARELKNHYIGTEHLLLGLLRTGDTLASRVLEKSGVTLERVRRMVADLQRNVDENQPRANGEPSFLETLRGRIHELSSTPGEPLLEGNTETALTRTEAMRQLAERPIIDQKPGHIGESIIFAVRLARTVCAECRDLIAIGDLSTDQAWALLSLARVMKKTLAVGKTAHAALLAGKTLAMIFEKPSLRTRVSFETGMFQLGGHAVSLKPDDIALGKRETVADVSHNLERMVDGIMARVFAHETIVELAHHARIPVINGLCDREHPCQALADLLTVWEHRGGIAGQKIVFVGDGNNVAHSLIRLGAKLGAHMVVASPEGYEPLPDIVAEARQDAEASGGSVTLLNDPFQACEGADVIYTDIWTSMGQEEETIARAEAFAAFQVNGDMVARAKADYLFMHCLPAHRGEEVSAEVMDSPHSVVFDQAENRLHAQKAVLTILLG